MPTPDLPLFRAALANCRAGVSDCRILRVGDSTEYGQGGGASPFASKQSRGAQLARLLRSYASVAAYVGLAAAANASGTVDARFAGTGWVTTAAYGAAVRSSYSTTTTNPMTFTPGAESGSCDTFDVWYVRGPGLAQFNVQATGGGTTLVTAANASTAIGKVTVTAGSAATTNAVTITPQSAAGVYVLHAQARSSTQKRLLMGIAGAPGATTGNWVQNDAAGGQTANGLQTIRDYAPDLTIVQIGKNDAGASVSTATYSANVQSIVTAAKVSGDCVLTSWSPSSGAPYTTFEPTYIPVLASLASTNGVPFWDCYTDLYGGAYDSTLQADALHPTGLGYMMQASYEFAKMRPYLDWLYPAASDVRTAVDRGNGDVGSLSPTGGTTVFSPSVMGRLVA